MCDTQGKIVDKCVTQGGNYTDIGDFMDGYEIEDLHFTDFEGNLKRIEGQMFVY